jgi:hypothetical protein
MKKLIRKKKFKGTRYVANVLRKYFKKKYPTYTAALPKAREVTEQLKSRGLRFTIKNVELLVRKHRPKKEAPTAKAPELFYKLKNAVPYFNLVDYPTYIHDTTDEIHFISGLFNADVDSVQGGKRPSYSKTFSEFVNFANKQINPDEYTFEYLVQALPPQWNKETKRWESKIATVTTDGDERDYGFEPSGEPSLEAIEKKISPKPTKELPQKKEQPPVAKSEKIIEKELELKISKEKSRQQANEMFLKGLLTKLEYKDEIRRINSL